MDPNNLLKRLDMEMGIKEVGSMLPEFIMAAKVMSKQMFEYYKALLEAGFTEDQALLLVAEHGIDIGRMSNLNQGGD